MLNSGNSKISFLLLNMIIHCTINFCNYVTQKDTYLRLQVYCNQIAIFLVYKYRIIRVMLEVSKVVIPIVFQKQYNKDFVLSQTHHKK